MLLAFSRDEIIIALANASPVKDLTLIITLPNLGYIVYFPPSYVVLFQFHGANLFVSVSAVLASSLDIGNYNLLHRR